MVKLSCLPSFLSRFSVAILRELADGEGTAMALNSVQFQKGLSEAAFEELYGTEENAGL